MFEVRCKNCGEKVPVQSFLAAAEKPCSLCGKALMGPMASGSRAPAAVDFGGSTSQPWREPGAGNSTALWFGVVAGLLAGVGLVAAIGFIGPTIPMHIRGAVLGALTGVLLAPVFAVFSFFSMFLPWTLESVLGDAMWTRLARGLHERRVGPLILPLIVFVGLPMGLSAWGGSKMTAVTNPGLVAATLGAIVLGAILGGVCGTLVGKAR